MHSFLIFESELTKYAIPAENVEGLFWLPELSPIEAAPPWFVGLVNWHGEVLHVLDLGLRFRHPARKYSISTNVILVSTPEMRCGIVADCVEGLIDVSDDDVIKRELVVPGDFSSDYLNLVAGEIKYNDEILILLNLRGLLSVNSGQEEIFHASLPATPTKENIALNELVQAKHAEIFRTRMHQLALPILDNKNENKESFALVIIGGIRYAIETSYVVEFTHLKQCVPLPCCPEYILGVINLRGEIISVIDMTSLLKIQNIVDKQDIVILKHDSKKIAVAVQQVEDVRLFDRNLITDVQDVEDRLVQCKSLLKIDGGVAGVLNIEAILLGDMLKIDEQI